MATAMGCGSRSELELVEPDAGVQVPRDAASHVDHASEHDEPPARDVAAIDRPDAEDADARDASVPPRDAAPDRVVDAAIDVPREARADAPADAPVDARRDAPPEASPDASDAAIEAARDAPAEARDATGETRDAAEVDASDANDGATCPVLGPPAKRFGIGVVESPSTAVVQLPDGGTYASIQECIDRMTAVFGAYADVERIPIASIDDRLARYDMVVLCSDWAEYDWATIPPHAPAFTRYVTGGGGLLMYQPNKTTRVDLLPAWYTLDFLYTDSSVSIVAEHPVVCGMDPTEVPYPADRILDFSPDWTALVRGDPSGAASLLVTELGAGRAAVDTGHNSKNAIRPESDRFLERLGRWLMKNLP
jgi:hypothetical protein